MLSVSRSVEYALSALGYLAERPRRVVAAREIADANNLPIALLMRILKDLQRHEVVTSTRGVKGGYALHRALESLSVYDLMRFMDHDLDTHDRPPGRNLTTAGPVQALRYRLARCLREVMVSDLVTPGRRIDVPLESVARCRCGGKN